MQLKRVRKALEWLESNPEVPLPDQFIFVRLTRYCYEKEELAETIRALRKTEKFDSTDWIRFERDLGEGLVYQVTMHKSICCERTKVGTRRIEAREAYEEPVYEYKCPESFLKET